MIIKLKLATLPSGEIDVAQCGLVGRSTANPQIEELIENVSVGSLTLNADGLPTLTLVVFNPTVTLRESRSFLGSDRYSTAGSVTPETSLEEREREPMSTNEDTKECYSPGARELDLDYDPEKINISSETFPLRKR